MKNEKVGNEKVNKPKVLRSIFVPKTARGRVETHAGAVSLRNKRVEELYSTCCTVQFCIVVLNSSRPIEEYYISLTPCLLQLQQVQQDWCAITYGELKILM